MRQFSKGPNVLFEYRPGMPYGAMGGTFSRSSFASYVDDQGRVRKALFNELRDSHWINGKRYLLREPSRQNLLLRSDIQGTLGSLPTSFSLFGQDNTLVVSNEIASHDIDYSDFVAKHTRVNSGGGGETDTNCGGQSFTGAASSTYAIAADVWIPDAFAGTAVLLSAEGAGLTAPVSVAADLTKRDQWQRIWVVATTTGSGGSVACILRITASGDTNFVYTDCWQAELGTFPTSWIQTDNVVMTRQDDLLSFAWAHLPQNQTAYVSGIDLGVGQSVNARLWQISGPNDLGPRHLVYFPSTPGTTYHQNANGGSSVISSTGSSNAFGVAFEHRAVLGADGSVQSGKTVAGGNETVANPSAGLALAAAWGTSGSPRLFIGNDGNGTQDAAYALEVIRFLPGTQSLAVMRLDYFTAIESPTSEMVHLLEFDFSSGIVRLNTGAQDVSWNGQTWEAVGGLLEMGGVEETNDARGQGVDVRLSGVEQSILAVLLNNNYRGRPVKIYRGHLNNVTGQFIGDPLLLFQGLQLNPYTVEEERDRGSGTVRISTRISGYFGVERVRGIQTNMMSHQHHFAGDTFFQHTTSLANTKIYWGTTSPSSVSRGGRLSGGDDGDRRTRKKALP